jgi:prepilin-type N-terminal cleavage/methylation domain-containing protein
MNKKGFTLIEIIFSVAFLSVVSVVMLNLLVTSFQLENETDTMDVAIIHLSSEIETIKSQAINDDKTVYKYYNELWLESDEKDATFRLELHVKKNPSHDRGLYDIEGLVYHIANQEQILELETKHYYHVKE